MTSVLSGDSKPKTSWTANFSLYKGDPGMWSWVLHRITGIAIFFFLFVHVLDTAVARLDLGYYNDIVETYKNPIMGLGEIGLVVALLYHALNGIRVILIDFWSQGPRFQKKLLWVIVTLWIFVSLAAFVRLGSIILKYTA